MSLPCFPFLATLAALLVAHASADAQTTLDPLLGNDALWTLDQTGFEKAGTGLPFAWTSNARDSARAARPGMTLFGLPVTEVVARFEQNKLTQITANFYARGDAGDLSEPKFKLLITEVIEAIAKASGAKHTVRGKDARSAVKAEGLIWQTPKARYTLEYSFTREVKSRDIPFRAEFVRLTVARPEKTVGLLASATGTARLKFIGSTHVKRDVASGDVWVSDVPMVDQGQKGYCVVASTERVMRYYGNPVDANELAQIANSDAEGGTSLQAMRDSLKKVSARLRVRVREVEDLGVKEILELLKDYNRAAKRMNEETIPDPGRMIDIGALFGGMKASVLKEAKTKNKSALGRFQRDVQAHIDQGVPLLWSVQLGLVPEPGLPQSGGGHMRLIIGYNPKAQEILYSDSWGPGHELKRMKADDAWTITTAIMTIEPMS